MKAGGSGRFFLGMILTASKRLIFQTNSASRAASQSAIARRLWPCIRFIADQKGFTMTMMTITIISTVGTSLANR